MNDVRLKMSPPWITYINELIHLFDGDPQIACNVDGNADDPSITLACNNGDKVAALQQILPEEVDYGNVVLRVVIDGTPSNRVFTNKKELFETAFKGNNALSQIVVPDVEGYIISAVYVIFKNCVVQFFNDNLNDAFGNISTLYQNIADDVLINREGVYFCTDVEMGKVGKPLGEWP